MSGLVHEASVPATMEWFTPPWLFDALGVQFDLDPCHPVERLPWVPAARVYNVHDDGLVLAWKGMVWLNPPYGKETPRWLARMASFWAGGQAQGIALVFSRTDTKWFGEVAATATAICFMAKRVRFVMPDGTVGGSPGAGSMLIAWGNDAAAALERSGLGPVWRLRADGTAPGVTP